MARFRADILIHARNTCPVSGSLPLIGVKALLCSTAVAKFGTCHLMCAFVVVPSAGCRFGCVVCSFVRSFDVWS